MCLSDSPSECVLFIYLGVRSTRKTRWSRGSLCSNLAVRPGHVAYVNHSLFLNAAEPRKILLLSKMGQLSYWDPQGSPQVKVMRECLVPPPHLHIPLCSFPQPLTLGYVLLFQKTPVTVMLHPSQLSPVFRENRIHSASSIVNSKLCGNAHHCPRANEGTHNI